MALRLVFRVCSGYPERVSTLRDKAVPGVPGVPGSPRVYTRTHFIFLHACAQICFSRARGRYTRNTRNSLAVIGQIAFRVPGTDPEQTRNAKRNGE